MDTPTSERPDAAQPRAQRTDTRASRRGWALLATSLGFGVVQLDVSVVNVAIKPIGADLGGGVSGAGRARAVGLLAAGASTALSAGPLAGGVLIALLGWRAIFFINAPIGLIGIVLTVRYAAETPRSPGRGADLPGQVAAIITLVALAAAMVEGGRRGFASPLVLWAAGLAVLAGTLFVFIESRRSKPMLPLQLFRSPTFSAATSIGLAVNIAFYGLIFVFSLYFQTTRHYSALVTGLAFLPTTVAVLAGNLLAGRVAAAIGVRRALAGAALLMAAGLAGLLIIGPSTGYPAIVTQLMVVGFGLGLLVPAMTSALLGSVDRSRSGVASGTLNSARQTGSVIGVALFGSLAAGSLVSGLRLGLVISIGLALLVVVLATQIGRQEATSR